jgi:hypothetical protein
MSPNTKKQKALRRIERAVGGTMPRDVYTPLSLLRVVDIEAFADWLEGVKDASDDERDSVVPIDDFEA